MSAAGTLYLVATPIGNLEDITLRAIRVLREADLIACEDTRHTARLLSHLDIRTPTLSLHEHNERARLPRILSLLREGKRVALVSDAGTPVISDPGAGLVAAVASEGLPIVAVPGPSAVTTAVVLADFPVERFAFAGFLPRKRAERRRVLESLVRLPMALVFFETPHRVHAALDDLRDVFGDRRMVLARELTKVHEQVVRGTPADLREALRAALGESPRGEVTLVVEGAAGTAAGPAGAAAEQGAERRPPELFLELLLARGISRRDAARVLEIVYGMPAREAYRLASRGE
ncbi:MAG: 16S rRNA (cytidine(1402)-2'-O)-methyltransferase [Armatimonadota bacterium]|nr:16S rRNA (cytidine(1402)-2'-O)-methyltransferase [Armatimonadota bacterium]